MLGYVLIIGFENHLMKYFKVCLKTNRIIIKDRKKYERIRV